MNTSNAEKYGRRAGRTDDASEVGENVRKAIAELVKEIRDLQIRVANLESQIHRRR